jgi:hypothetical protein
MAQDAVWGFSQTHHTSKRIANAVVLTGEKIGIHISARGDGVGYITIDGREEIIYAQTSLLITLFDIHRGRQKDILFNSFKSEVNDGSRYILWNVQEADDAAKAFYSAYGYHGLYDIRIREISSLYWDSDFTSPVKVNDQQIVTENESHLQVISIWWKQLLHDIDISSPTRNVGVLENASVMTGSISLAQPDSEQAIFTKYTRYPLFLRTSGAQVFDISPEYKSIILRDYCLGLLTTQCPLLTSDYPLSPTIGIGIGSLPPATPSTTLGTKIDLYEFSSIDLHRLGSLNGNYAAFNNIDTANSLTDNHQQSLTRTKDPIRLFTYSDTSSVKLVMSSIDSPRLIKHSFSEDKKPDTIVFSKKENYISDYGVTISSGMIKIDFNKNDENKDITSVSFGIGLDDKNYYKFIDENGGAQEINEPTDAFDRFPESGGLVNSVIGVLRTGQEVADFYKVSSNTFDNDSSPKVDNFRAAQRVDGTGIVDLYYDYISFNERVLASVYINVFDTEGNTVSIDEKTFNGDIGANVRSGLNRHIVWKPFDNQDFTEKQVYFVISLMDIKGRSATGETTSGLITLDKSYGDILAAARTISQSGNIFLMKHDSDDIKGYVYEDEDIKNTELSFEDIHPIAESSSSSLAVPSSESSSTSTQSNSSTSSESSKSSETTSFYIAVALGKDKALIDEIFKDAKKTEDGQYIIIDW